jgi:MYXO-CTERM domain-containing protein
MMELAIRNSDGAALFEVPLWLYDLDYFHNGTIFQQLINDDPAFDYKLGLPSGRWGTCISWYQAIAQNISVPEDVTSAGISFNIRDTRGISSLAGYHFKQLLVNDEIIWDVDISEDGTDTLYITEDIAAYLSGLDKAELSIRFFDEKPVGNYPANIYVGNIEVHINGELINNNWIFESGIEDISKYMEVYNIVKDVLNPYSKGVLTGVVTDADTGLAVGNALVSDGMRFAVVDGSGAFTIPDIPMGIYTFTASADNYGSVSENVEITAGNTTTVHFGLELEDPTVPIDPDSQGCSGCKTSSGGSPALILVAAFVLLRRRRSMGSAILKGMRHENM